VREVAQVFAAVGAKRASRGRRRAAWRCARGGIASVVALALLGVLTAVGLVLAVALALDGRSAADARPVAAARSHAAGEAAGRAPAADSAAARRARAVYGRLPLAFAPNAGQADGRVRYLAQVAGSSLFFTERHVVLAFTKPTSAGEQPPGALVAPGPPAAASIAARPASRGLALQLRFVGANPDVRLQAGERGAGTLNYLVGERSEWKRGLPTYRELTYRELWPGIDLVFRGRGGTLKYEFHVAPGADVRAIGLAYRGAERLSLGSGGGLLVHTALGTLTDARPVSYQRRKGRRIAVESRYALRAGRQGYGFALGAGYDRTRPLVIDPGLDYSTFLGGADLDDANGVAVGRDGSAYITGHTASADFPATPGAYDRTFNGGFYGDAFVTKLNRAGSALEYSTFLGGAGIVDAGNDIAVDRVGNAYVTGLTGAGDFPTTPGAFDATLDGTHDAFVAKLDRSGSVLVYSTLLGGTGFDDGSDLAVDRAGNAYLTGVTTSGDYPTTRGAIDATLDGGQDGFATKLDRSGSALAYSTFLGGTNSDAGHGIAVDRAGTAHVTGGTSSADFPTTPGAVDPTFNGDVYGDAFVTKLDRSGSALAYSTFLGGTSGDEGDDIAVDKAGNAYVTGQTVSADFPTTAGAFDPSFNGGFDAFVAKLDRSGSALAYSTFLGGTSIEQGVGIAVDRRGKAYVTGQTSSADYPTTSGAFDPTLSNGDAFVTKLNGPGSALTYSTFLGGTSGDEGDDIAVDNAGNAYVTGRTVSGDYPNTPGAFDTTPNGGFDAFVTKLKIDHGEHGQDDSAAHEDAADRD
jgi:hypothetical protein